MAFHTRAGRLLVRSPIRIDGATPTADKAAPRVGEHNEAVLKEFNLNAKER
ncbi:hypothetical protein [Paenibacillus sp. GCM10027626]|uniref:hypothetical protein n=1 Tax=Paenibacillus sp. GCM10027626 TaxID=3273411 RepID=UPI003632E318